MKTISNLQRSILFWYIISINYPKGNTILKHYLSILISLLTFTLSFSCSDGSDKDTRSHLVLTTLAPYKFFVEQIAGNTIQTKLIVPTGASPHSYEPTSRQVLEASRADIWFLIGEPFEERSLQALKSYRKEMKAIDMREGIPLLDESEDHHHHHCRHIGCKDPHIWMSPRLVKKQAETIAKTLSDVYPENKELFQKNLKTFQKNLDNLDLEISKVLQSMRNHTILVSHPAYAYFCKDYGIKQISIEFEGKDPSPKQLTELLQKARENKSPFIFIQQQNPSKGARLIAREIGAEVINLDPLAENYFENMISISKSLSAQ